MNFSVTEAILLLIAAGVWFGAIKMEAVANSLAEIKFLAREISKGR